MRDNLINVSRQHNRGMDVALRYNTEQPSGWGFLTVDTQHTFGFDDTVGLFDNTEEDRVGLAGHPEWVGNLNLTLQRDPWSFFRGTNFVGETNNLERFGRETVVDSTRQTVVALPSARPLS